jgi:TOM7 family
MPVPKRRGDPQGGTLSVSNLSKQLMKLLDIHYVFQRARTLLLFGFAPAAIYIGLRTEPKPSLWDIFNLWE